MIWLPIVVVILGLLGLAGHALRTSLERRAKSLDLTAFLREAGLEGRVLSYQWKRVTVDWLPRPALVLEEVEASLFSGQPGPGAVSGLARIRRLRLIPRLDYPLHHGLERIEASGGLLEIHPDLLPDLPRFYIDPMDGQRHPLPYLALLRMVGDSLKPSPMTRQRLGVTMGDPLSAGFAGGPAVRVKDLDIRLASLDVLPGTELHLKTAVLAMAGGRMEIQGDLRAVGAGFSPRVIPVQFSRVEEPDGRGRSWEAHVGQEGQGELRLTGHPSGEPGGIPAWSIVLSDPAGGVAAALLENPSIPLLRRLRWVGPWRLQVAGVGSFSKGIKETRIELLDGRICLTESGAPSPLSARGVLSIRPGRIDLSSLSLRSVDSPGDSARIQLEWLRTLQGKRMQGRLEGRIAPAWLALAGDGWRAAGSLDCSASFEASFENGASSWVINPRGKVSGTLDSLVAPIFAETLRQVRCDAWVETGRLHLLLVGQAAESPFRLEAGGLPPPAPDYLELLAQDSWWSFRSPWCRLEDFALRRARDPAALPLPFWLGLPGRGRVEITRGSVAGQPFDHLSAAGIRLRSRFRLDSLTVELCGGRLYLDREPRGWTDQGDWNGIDTRLKGENLDLASIQRILRAYGAFPRGEFRGKLSGSLRVRQMGHDLSENRALVLDGSLEASDGSVRGLPLQEALRRSTHLEALAALSFRRWRMDIHRDSDGLSWERLRLESPPFKVEGAGRLLEHDTVQAVFSVGLSSDGGGDPLTGLLRSLLGAGRSSLYVLLRGSLDTPSVELVSRATFLKELDSLGAKLLPG